MSKGRDRRAFNSLARLRWSNIQAARDLFYMHTLLLAEGEMARGPQKLKEMFTVGRNRRAMVASTITMFMQQFCGVNVIAYYSSSIFSSAGFSNVAALLASMGFGIINFLFALPGSFHPPRSSQPKLTPPQPCSPSITSAGGTSCSQPSR